MRMKTIDFFFKLFGQPWNKVLFVTGFLFCVPFLAYSHTPLLAKGVDNQGSTELIKNIYEKAGALSPQVLFSVEESLTQAYVKVGGRFIPLDSGFWELVKGWIRLYRREIETYCPCDINEEELIKTAKDDIAKGFTYSKIGRPVGRLSEKIVIGSYGLSAKYGKTAVLLKASAEVAETALSLFVGGKGVHIICNVIDGLILFLFRKTQIYTRVFNNSRNMNKSRLIMMFRLAYFNRLMKKAQRKVFFHLETANTDPSAIDRVDREGAGTNKRARYVHSLSQKTGPILEQIQEVDTLLKDNSLTERKRKSLLRQRARLLKKIKQITQVQENSFFGKRYKRFLFLMSRKHKPDYLQGVSYADKITSMNWFWALSVQENILERALLKKAEDKVLRGQESSFTPLVLKTDSIRTGLAKEFTKKTSQERGIAINEQTHIWQVERMLMDIDNIFNPSLSTTERYLLVSVIETGLSGFFEHYLRLIYNQITEGADNIWTKGKLRYRLERFTYYVFIYSDFLRTVALINNRTKTINYKYEAMESFLLFFDYLQRLSQIAHSGKSNADILEELNQNNRRLQAFQVQREKRTAFSWMPFSTPLPYCRNLIRSL